MVKPISVRIVGEPDFAKAQAQIKSTFGSLGKIAAVTAAAGGAAIAGAAAGAFKLGQSFEAVNRDIAVATGASGEKLAALNESFNQIASNVPDDFGVVSGIVGDLNTLLGLTGDTLSDVGIQLADAGRLLGEDANGITNSFGKMAKQIGLADDELSPFADGLFKLTQDFGIGFAALTDQIATVRPALQFAFSDEEIAGLVATLDSVGISATQIQGPFSKFLKGAADAGQEPRQAFADLVDQIKGASSEADALNLGFEAFGSRGGSTLVAAIREGTLSLDDLGAAFEGTEGLIADTNGEVASLGEKWAEFRNKLAVKIRPVAAGAFDLVERALDRAGPLLETIGERIARVFGIVRTTFRFLSGDGEAANDFFANLTSGPIGRFFTRLSQTAFQFIETAKAAFSALKGIFSGGGEGGGGGLREILEGVLSALTPIVVAVGDFFSALRGESSEDFNQTAVTLANGVREFGRILIDDVIPAVRQFISAVGETFSKLAPRVLPILEKLGSAVQAAFELVAIVVQRVVQVISFVWSNWGNEILTVIEVVFNAVVGVISGALDIIIGIVRVVTAVLQGDWSAAWDGIKQILSGAWQIIISLLRLGWETLKGLFNAGKALLKSIWSAMWAGIKASAKLALGGLTGAITGGLDRVISAFRRLPGRIASAVGNLFQPIYDRFKSVIDRIRGLWDALDFKIPEVNIPGLGKVGGGSISGALGRLPFFASGNVATEPTIGVFGEYPGARSNPEITTPQRTMEDSFRRVLLDMGRSPGVQIGQVVVQDGRDFEQTIDAMARRYMRQ
ncbi:MAG: hypothetical protein AAGA65_09140 [Actinomycetota bacterium]